MCWYCWQDYGAPTDLPADATRLVGLIEELYARPDGGTGGPLHVLLDDFGVDCVQPYDMDRFTPLTRRLAERIVEGMAPLSEEQRAAVLALREGWLDRPPGTATVCR